MDNKVVGERIKQSRKAKGYTLMELSNLIGISHATLSRWEHGIVDKISMEYFVRLGEILGVDPGWLCDIFHEEPDNTVERVMDAATMEVHFMANIMDACEKYGNLGKNFTEDDWREIVAYIKMKASIRDV